LQFTYIHGNWLKNRPKSLDFQKKRPVEVDGGQKVPTWRGGRGAEVLLFVLLWYDSNRGVIPIE
jgi:hypothetical protein